MGLKYGLEVWLVAPPSHLTGLQRGLRGRFFSTITGLGQSPVAPQRK
jgi:hypothetical protein